MQFSASAFAEVDRRAERVAMPAEVPLTHWDPCLGCPPITLEFPRWFFGLQVVAGLVSLAVLLIVEGAR